MPGEGCCYVVGITEAGVRSGSKDDVHTVQQRSELLLKGDLLKVRHEDDFIHAFGFKLINGRLNLRSEKHHVIGLKTVSHEAFHLDTACGRDAFEDLGGDGNETNFFTAFGDYHGGCDATVERVGFGYQ